MFLLALSYATPALTYGEARSTQKHQTGHELLTFVNPSAHLVHLSKEYYPAASKVWRAQVALLMQHSLTEYHSCIRAHTHMHARTHRGGHSRNEGLAQEMHPLHQLTDVAHLAEQALVGLRHVQSMKQARQSGKSALQSTRKDVKHLQITKGKLLQQ
eukprot:scaffold61634_cov18-Tisochrysis_lutea.AAC.2